MSKVKNYLKLMRIKHYIKNILIFLPLIFSKNLFNKSDLMNTVIAFFVFSFTCSIVYIFNDIKDKEKDKLHQTKKNRPIASGAVSVKEAVILMGVIFLIVVCGLMLCKFSFSSIILILLYLILNISYSLYLKNIPLVDIIILVSGFIIRVLFGAVVIDVPVSDWLYLTIITASFYLVLGKRRNEIIETGKNTRKVLQYYNKEFLDKNMYMCLALTIVFYSLWSVSLENNNLVLTVPLVIIICMRYSINIEGNSDGDPVEVVFSDKVLMTSIVLFGALIIGLLYV